MKTEQTDSTINHMKRNKMADIILALLFFTEKPHASLKEINNFIRFLGPNHKLLMVDADYPYWKPNYVASLLENYSTRRKKPCIHRDKNDKGRFIYWVTEDYKKKFGTF